MLDILVARSLHNGVGLTLARSCEAIAGAAAWECLTRKPFTVDPATGRPEPFLTLSVAPDLKWFAGHLPEALARMTVNLLPVYVRVRQGLDRLLAQRPDERIAAFLREWDAWFAAHLAARRAEGRSPG